MSYFFIFNITSIAIFIIYFTNKPDFVKIYMYFKKYVKLNI